MLLLQLLKFMKKSTNLPSKRGYRNNNKIAQIKKLKTRLFKNRRLYKKTYFNKCG